MSNDLQDAFRDGVEIKRWQTDSDHLGDLRSNAGEEGIFYYKDKFYIISFNDTYGMYDMELQNPAPLDISELDDELRIPCEKYLLYMDRITTPRKPECNRCGCYTSEPLCLRCEKALEEESKFEMLGEALANDIITQEEYNRRIKEWSNANKNI